MPSNSQAKLIHEYVNGAEVTITFNKVTRTVSISTLHSGIVRDNMDPRDVFYWLKGYTSGEPALLTIRED